MIRGGYFTIIRRVVSVTNQNERYIELLNLNDEEHMYLNCIEYNLL